MPSGIIGLSEAEIAAKLAKLDAIEAAEAAEVAAKTAKELNKIQARVFEYTNVAGTKTGFYAGLKGLGKEAWLKLNDGDALTPAGKAKLDRGIEMLVALRASLEPAEVEPEVASE